MLPPLEQHRVTDELKPGCEHELWVAKHFAEVISRGIAGGLDLTKIGFDVDVGFNEQNIVD